MCNRWSSLQILRGPNCKGTMRPNFSFFFTADHFLPSADDHSAHAATMTPLFARESDDIHLFFHSFLVFFTKFNCYGLNNKKLILWLGIMEIILIHQKRTNTKKQNFEMSFYAHTRAVTGQSHNTSTKLPHPRSPVFSFTLHHYVLNFQNNTMY